jgi:hypothetical protein
VVDLRPVPHSAGEEEKKNHEIIFLGYDNVLR